MIRALRLSSIAALLEVAILGLLMGCATREGAVRDGEYTGPNRMFSVRIPKPSNPFGVPYTITTLDTKGDTQYDKVMFHADDFGQYLVAGVRVVPARAVSEMNKDEPRTVLRNLSEATLMGWRTDFDALPEFAQDSWLDTKYGEGIMRVYNAKKGSILTKAQGRRPTRDDAFDTNIASIVARQGSIVVFVLAQNDASPDDSNVVVRMATEMFRTLSVSAGR